MHVPLVYKKKPLLGFDIGTHAIKIVQLQLGGLQVAGYGYVDFPETSIVEGLVVDAAGLAKIVQPLLKNPDAGSFSTNRVAAAIPVAKVFTRTLQLPIMDKGDLEQAINLQVEQYVPVPLNDLYVDYEIIPSGDAAKSKEQMDVLMVAAPKSIVDSYMKLFQALGLEVESIEASLSALTRAMISAQAPAQTALIVDFGSKSVDMAIYDQVIRVTGTISIGGDQLTAAIAKGLDVDLQRADEIKVKFGIAPGELQDKIMDALTTPLQTIVTEMQKTIKYYAEREGGGHQIQAIMVSGGSASMPGLSDYLFGQTKIPVMVGNPWKNLQMGSLQSDQATAPMYSTAIGLALTAGLHD